MDPPPRRQTPLERAYLEAEAAERADGRVRFCAWPNPLRMALEAQRPYVRLDEPMKFAVILAMVNERLTYVEITQRFGISRGSIQRIMDEYKARKGKTPEFAVLPACLREATA